MSPLERTLADYKSTGLTTGPHIMHYLRDELRQRGVLSARELGRAKNGKWVKIAGLVIVRQRPGTAKGFCFLTLEDETGTANAVVFPDMFQKHRTTIHTAALLQVEGPIQKVKAGVRGQGPEAGTDPRPPAPDPRYVIHVRARRFTKLEIPRHALEQTGTGYRMRPTPTDNEQPNNEQPVSFPKSHDFR